MSSYESLLACDHCKQLLEKPLIVPCGFTVCEKHIVDESLTFSPCLFCKENHTLPLKHNIKFAELIDKLNEALRAETAVKQELASYKSLKQQPDVYFEEYFKTVKNEIEMKRERILALVEAKASECLEKVNAFRVECLTSLSQSEYLMNVGETFLQDIDAKLNAWQNELKLDKISRPVWAAIVNDSKNIAEELSSKTEELHSYLTTFKRLKFESSIVFDFGNVEVLDNADNNGSTAHVQIQQNHEK
jgi:hypothetical protein